MNSKLGRIRVMENNTFGSPLPYGGCEGWALGYVVPHSSLEDAYLTRVALDDGRVFDITDAVLENIPHDATAEILGAAPPPITTLDQQSNATLQMARVYQLMEQNRVEILDIEAYIKQRQTELAQSIRGEHAELYESQRISGIVFNDHETRLQAGAEALWQAAGCPDKGKTFGAAQIADDWQCVTFDPDKALEYARTQIPALISTHVDETKFKKAVKDGLLKDVPSDVCRWEKGHKVKTLTTVLNGLKDNG